jgi:hypothetical protein
MFRYAAGLLLVCLATCAGASAAVGTAVVNTAVALSSSAVSRAQGDCYASCPSGTACNKQTGLCDAKPCHDACRADEQCVQTGVVERCEPRQVSDLNLGVTPGRVTPQ